MATLAKSSRATVIPCLRDRNAPAAIEWPCETFGFERRLLLCGDLGPAVEFRHP